MVNKKKKKKWIVLKFGGTSVSSRECWQQIAEIIQRRKKENLRPLIVCSAYSGISNKLEELISKAKTENPKKILKKIADLHSRFATELKVDEKIIRAELDLLKRLSTGIALLGESSPKKEAEIMSLGEIMLTKIACNYLNHYGISTEWIDARKILQTKDKYSTRERQKYLSAECDLIPDRYFNNHFKKKSSVIITQGFIASNKEGETVLLGRGGSDISASYFAVKAKAKRCEIWTDVPGMFTANPKEVPPARLLTKLSYDEAQEIASSGAKVLHPKCIKPVEQYKIPLNICCFSHPEIEGTIISDQKIEAGPDVKAIAKREGIKLISMDSISMWHQPGFLAEIFDCFKKHSLSVDLVSTSESNVTVTLDDIKNTASDETIDLLKKDLEEFCKVKVIEQCAILALVGRNIRKILHRITPALEVFDEHKIYLLTQAANDLNLTFVVDENQAKRLVKKLHDNLFSHDKKAAYLGTSWQSLFEDKRKKRGKKPWWVADRKRLLKEASVKTPLYVYSNKKVKEQISQLKSLKAVDRVFYSVKANPHPEILNQCRKANFGFECVSKYEIAHVQNLFPELPSNKILFTPNFVPLEEYKYGLNKDVYVTLDNIYPLKAWPETFRGKEIFIRIDPGEGKGHHKYVHTAGNKAKFGIWPSQLTELEELTKKLNIKVIGLHAHVGSNIFSATTWKDTALFLIKFTDIFKEVKYIDVGGGLGVIEKPGGDPLNIKKLNSYLEEIKNAYPDLEIWIEPGRFISAEAGVLLAKVTQTKSKGEFDYIGIDAGMNTLIRPALYGSYHEIINLSRQGQKKDFEGNIVGPICESGDILGYSRRLPKPTDSDIILITNAGAYGKVMSSKYNLRPLADEIYLK